MQSIREAVCELTDYEEVDHGEMKTFSLMKPTNILSWRKKENFSGKLRMDETVSWSNKGRSKIHIILF